MQDLNLDKINKIIKRRTKNRNNSKDQQINSLTEKLKKKNPS